MSDEQLWPHRERIKVRYQEVDLQNVVFNAHYMGWCDIATAAWFHDALGWTGVDDDLDWMLVKAQLEWQGSATYGDSVDVDCGIARWGNTSLDVAFRGTVAGRPVFTALITYVCIVPGSAKGTTKTTPVSERMRSALALAPTPT